MSVPTILHRITFSVISSLPAAVSHHVTASCITASCITTSIASLSSSLLLLACDHYRLGGRLSKQRDAEVAEASQGSIPGNPQGISSPHIAQQKSMWGVAHSVTHLSPNSALASAVISAMFLSLPSGPLSADSICGLQLPLLDNVAPTPRRHSHPARA